MICHTGGAEGADLLFENETLRHGGIVCAYSFAEHARSSRSQRLVPLSIEALSLADNAIKEALNHLPGGMNAPTRYYIKQLIQRNYFQVLNAGYIVAVSDLTADKKYVKGGTGWAVAMAISMTKPIMVYDQVEKKLYKYNYIKAQFEHMERFPSPNPNIPFAGIGTRKLNPYGEAFIRKFTKVMKENLKHGIT